MKKISNDKNKNIIKFRDIAEMWINKKLTLTNNEIYRSNVKNYSITYFKNPSIVMYII